VWIICWQAGEWACLWNNIGGGSTIGVAAKAFSGWGLSAAWYVLAATMSSADSNLLCASIIIMKDIY